MLDYNGSIWDRKIDLILGKRAKIKCIDGNTYVGVGIGDCLVTNDLGEDEDGLRFKTDNGEGFLLAESDILEFELID